MKIIAILCIAFLVITGIVSAAGLTPQVKVVQNTSIAAVPVPTTQPPADAGIISNLVSPIIRVIPGAAATPSVQATVSASAPGTPPQPRPIPTGGMATAQKFSNLLITNIHAGLPSDPCSPDNSNLRSMFGQMGTVYVLDRPVSLWGGLLYEQDGYAYTLLSDNPNVLSMMQTALAGDKYLTVTAYPVPPNPDDGFSMMWTPYRVCSMVIMKN